MQMDTLRFRKTFCLIFNKEQNGHKLADISDKKQKIEIIQQRSRIKCICIMKKVIWNKRKGNKVFSAPVEIRTPNLLIRSDNHFIKTCVFLLYSVFSKNNLSHILHKNTKNSCERIKLFVGSCITK